MLPLARPVRPAIALLLVVMSCAGVSSDGPLSRPNDLGELCAPVPPDGSLTFGLETLTNSADTDVVVESVRLVEAEGISIIESRIVTISDGQLGGTLVGLRSGFPPDELPGWSASILAEGAAILPADSTDDVFNLVVGLRLDSGSSMGTASGLEVAYSVKSSHYTYRTSNSIELRHEPCS